MMTKYYNYDNKHDAMLLDCLSIVVGRDRRQDPETVVGF